MQPVLVEFDDPIPATVRLPGLGGAVEGFVTLVEVRPCGEMWVRTKIQTWQRWRTQVKVGKPAIEGIGPGWTEVWAPSTAIAIDSERGPEVAATVKAAKAGA
ncbi:hypothetical protein AB0872_20660 [Microbacterium sp. NPDC047426]